MKEIGDFMEKIRFMALGGLDEEGRNMSVLKSTTKFTYLMQE